MIVINSKPMNIISVEVDHNSPVYHVSNIYNWQNASNYHGWRIPTDIIETNHALIIIMEIAGMDEKDFEVYVESTHVKISGQRSEHNEAHRAYHQMEIHYGIFSLDIDLPLTILPKDTTAKYQNGFLTINLPKTMNNK